MENVKLSKMRLVEKCSLNTLEENADSSKSTQGEIKTRWCEVPIVTIETHWTRDLRHVDARGIMSPEFWKVISINEVVMKHIEVPVDVFVMSSFVYALGLLLAHCFVHG